MSSDDMEEGGTVELSGWQTIESKKRKRKHEINLESGQEGLNPSENGSQYERTTYQVLLSNASQDKKLAKMNPLSFAKFLKDSVGEVASVQPTRLGDLIVHCKSQEQARHLLQIHSLGKETLIASPLLKKRQGVIFGVDEELSDADIIDNLQGQGVTQAKRLPKSINKDGKRMLIPSTCILITFCQYH